MNRKWKTYVAVTAMATMILGGCSGASQSQTEQATAQATEQATTAAGTITTSTESQVVVDTEYTARDLDVGYEDSTSTHITFEGTSIAVAEEGSGATVKDNVVTISKEGTYVVSGTLSDGQIVVEASDTDKIQIVLNTVSITCSNNAPIYIKSANKVFITMADNTENTLTDGLNYEQTDDNTVDGVIFSMADLTINGNGTLNVTGNYKHGIASKDDLIITSGTYNITAVKDALNAKDCVKIKDGTLTLSATDGNGIQSKNGDDTTKGYVYISGGKITVTKAQEGIEGTVILIADGIIDITAADDGLNAASGSSDTESGMTSDPAATTESDVATAAGTDSTTNDAPPAGMDKNMEDRGGFGKDGGAMENDSNCNLTITGGTLTVNASGDAIDSNGTVSISGGTIYVSGPTNSGNGGLDYNGTANITGGTIVVAGSSGMAQGFSDTSTQYSILNNFTTECAAGTEIKLIDKDGNVILSYTPEKQYQSVVISTPDLEKDATYTLTCGDQTTELTLSTVVTSNGEQSMGGGFGGQGKPSGGQRPDQQQ